jgi:hypothetical protein
MKPCNPHLKGVKLFTGLALAVGVLTLSAPKPAHALLPGCILQGTQETYEALGYPYELFERIVLDFIASQEPAVCTDTVAFKVAATVVLNGLRASNPEVFAPGGWLYGNRIISEFLRDLQRNACNTDQSQCEFQTPPVCP